MRHFRLKTKAATEPVTVADVKLYARVAHNVEDALITTWISAGRKLAEDYQHRSYIEQVYNLTFDSFPDKCIEIPMPPLLSIDSVRYYDEDNVETTVSTSDYFVDTTSEIGRLAFTSGFSWPSVTLRPLNGLIIEFTAGYGATAADTPDSVKNAIYIYCTHMFENRESESGTIPREFFDLLQPDRMAVY
jgi:uncharacterized phiE125 gp8 family phage protein